MGIASLGSREQQKRGHDAHATARSFSDGDSVYARNYSSGPKWLPGVVVGVEGSVVFEVQLGDGRVIRRHVDQLRSRVAITDEEVPRTEEPTEGVPPARGATEGERDVELDIPETRDSDTPTDLTLIRRKERHPTNTSLRIPRPRGSNI